MSEKILKALMQLFAIIAKVDGVTNNGREIVQSFLKQQLNQEMVDEYLKLFDQFLEAHHHLSDSTKKKKRTSVNSVKVLVICTQINAELTQRQKIVVLIRLIEFINSSGEVTDQELEFVSTVCQTFNIEEEEFARCMSFVNYREGSVTDSPFLLIIDNNKSTSYFKTKHIYSEGLNGRMRVLHIPSVNMYVVCYDGTSELYLNGQIMSKDKIYILTQGSSIRSNKLQPIYYSDVISSFMSDTTKAKISFQVKDLEYKFKNGGIGVQKINIAEESGKLIGIMGGSGAGKSTLLNVLNGNEKNSGGNILINGLDIHKDKKKLEGVIGHISQDDLLIEELTVFQNLYYNAKLCFDKIPDKEVTQMVLDLLGDIGIYETKDLKVGSPLDKTISGGQRKRLNIALELIREPSILFVDEPTSGLSSRDSENIMDLLKELSLKGKLVFVVIHQPSSDIFKMFDKLIIMDLGGFPIYNGNPVDGVIYFKTLVNHAKSNESECLECGNVNPEQIFNIIESKVLDEYGNQTRNRKVSPKEWNQHYKEKIESKVEFSQSNGDIPKSTFNIPNSFKQFRVFITRDVLSKLTNKQYMMINMLEAPLLAFILAYLVKFYNTDISNTIGYIFRENENMPAYLLMSVVVSLFIGLTVSAEEIIRDRKILKRESFLNLSKSSYLLSKIAIMFAISAIQTFTFVLIGNGILEIKGMHLDYWLILFSASCFANMLGLNISSSFNSAVTIYILIPFLIIPQLILSGVIVKFDKLNPTVTSQSTVPFWGEVMASRWAFEALSVNQFKCNKYEKMFYDYEKIMSYSDFRKNFWIPKLRAKVDKCQNNINTPGAKKDVENDLALLKLEIGNEMKLLKGVKFAYLDSLTLKGFSPNVFNETRSYLNILNNYYVKLYNKATDAREKIITKQNATEKKKQDFIKLKNDYYNESLSDLVRNANDVDKILEQDGRLIQRADPVFLDPTDSKFVRSHFFAPRKFVINKYYDTFWVNVAVIWGMSLLLALTLYLDFLRRILNLLENIFGGLVKRKKK